MKRARYFRWILISALVALVTSLAVGYAVRKPASEMTRVQLSELITAQKVEKGYVTPTVYPGIYRVTGKWKDGAELKKFDVTTRLEEEQVKALLGKSGVKIEMPGQGLKNQWVNIVTSVLVLALVGGLLFYQMNIGRGKSSRVKERPSVRFADVAGVEEAKSEVQEVVDFLRNPKKYKKLGGKLPKGVLLVGPPGTGKTMLAKAIAGEADANFFSAHGSDFNEVFVGVGAKRIRQLFSDAAKHKPAIIFIDEIDCLGKNRKFDSHGELQQTNNALLAAMDGFESNEGIVVVAATNRPEDMDEALLRPGRFDRKVHVLPPDMKGRRAILKAHAKEKPIQREEALDVIAQTTPGMSGADLANLINEAAILCAQKNMTTIDQPELEAARDKILYGKERKSMVMNKKEREMVAFHEAGHTIINLQKSLLPPLYKVSIVPRGMALGVTTLLPNEDQNIHSKELLLQELVVLMGGRAAERTFYGATTNGASGDLDMARKVARKMIHEWGMGEKLYYEPEKQDAEIEINRLLEAADQEALAIIQRKRTETEKLAHALLERETLTRAEVVELIQSPTTESSTEITIAA